jgi:plasmid stabilization system protein ParE
MSYRVIYAPSFRTNIADQVDYLREQHVPDDIIEAWFERLFVLLDQLSEWPRQYPVDERMTKELGFEVRKFVYARHVITYAVDDAGKRVELLGMVHGARRK